MPRNFSSFFAKVLDIPTKMCYNLSVAKAWGYSSAGRALEWHSRGQRFDPAYLHQQKKDGMRRPFSVGEKRLSPLCRLPTRKKLWETLEKTRKIKIKRYNKLRKNEEYILRNRAIYPSADASQQGVIIEHSTLGGGLGRAICPQKGSSKRAFQSNARPPRLLLRV